MPARLRSLAVPLLAALAVVALVLGLQAAGHQQSTPVDQLPRAVTTTTVAYGADPRQNYDATVDNALTAAPWVAVVHGGSWAAGAKSSSAAVAAMFAAAGFQVFNVEYRVSYGNPGTAWPGMRDDVVAAVDHIKANAATFHIDPARGALYGFSAGAHIAVTAAVQTPGLTRAVVSVSGPLQPDRLRNSVYAGTAGTDETTLAFQAVAALQCGNYTWTTCAARWTSMRPDQAFDPTDPPLYLMHGDADTVIPVVTATSISYWANNKGVERALVIVAGLGHTEAVATGDPTRWAALVAWLQTKTA